jgi:PAS domain S-box-containing protein
MDDPGQEESERRYRQLIRTSPAPINLFDASGEIIWGNDAVVDLLGLDSRDQLVGSSIFEYISPADEETARAELRTVVEEKQSTGPTSMTLRRVDGDTRQILVSTAPGRYDGRDIGQAVVLDVTELRESQAELRRQREFIEDALDTLQDVFYVISPDGTLERWNDELRELSGYSDEELQGKPVGEFFVERDVDLVSETLETAMREGSDEVEATIRTKDGTEIPYEFRKRRLTDGDDVVGLVGVGRDISARKIRDQHIRTVDHLLKHNLRNQVNVIQAAVDLLESADGEPPAERFRQIESASDRLLSIFENHHQIVSLLTSQTTNDDVDVAAILDHLEAEMAGAHPSATVAVDCPETALVRADSMLEQAVFELVESAIEHSDREEPTVTVAVETGEETVSIRVSDDGPAIPTAEYRSLSDSSRLSATFHPTELGLWFVHLVVMQSDGTIDFAENEPRGNVIEIELRRSDR